MLVVLIFLVLLLFLYSRRKYKATLGRGLLLLLAVAFVGTLVVGQSVPSYSKVSFGATLYLVVVFLIWIAPFLDVSLVDGLVSRVGRREYVFAIVMIVLTLPSTFFYIGSVVEIFSGNAASMLDVRHEVNNTVVEEGRSWSITNLFIAGAQLYVIALYLFFLSITQKWSKTVTILLLLGSFSFPLYCLSRLGRDGVVLWGINSLLFYSIFKNYYPQKVKKRIGLALAFFGTIVIGFLFVISSVRFSEDFLVGTVGYIGQSIPNFNRFFGAKTDYSQTIFPGLYNLLGIKYKSYSELMIRNGLSDLTNSFSTFVPNLVLSYGYYGAVVFSLFVAFVITRLKILAFKKGSNFGMMCILVMMQIPMNGVFYYRQGIGNGDVYMVISIALLLLYPAISKFFLKI